MEIMLIERLEEDFRHDVRAGIGLDLTFLAALNNGRSSAVDSLRAVSYDDEDVLRCESTLREESIRTTREAFGAVGRGREIKVIP